MCSPPDSLEKLLLRACGILVPDHVVYDDLDHLLRLDPAVRMVARLHLADLCPVVDLFARPREQGVSKGCFSLSFISPLFLLLCCFFSSFFFFFFSHDGGVHTRSTSASVSRSSNSASWLSDSWYFPGGAILVEMSSTVGPARLGEL